MQKNDTSGGNILIRSVAKQVKTNKSNPLLLHISPGYGSTFCLCIFSYTIAVSLSIIRESEICTIIKEKKPFPCNSFKFLKAQGVCTKGFIFKISPLEIIEW